MSEVFHRNAYALSVARTAVAADFADFFFGVFRNPPGQVFTNFIHEADEFVVVAERDLEIEVAGETARCAPADQVLIPAQASHTLRTAQSGGSTCFYGYDRFGHGDG